MIRSNLRTMFHRPRTIPFEESYWISPGRLLAGCYPGAVNPNEAEENLIALKGIRILTCIDLTEENEVNIAGQPLMAYEAQWIRLASRANAFEICSWLPRDIAVSIGTWLSGSKLLFACATASGMTTLK